MEKYHRNKQIIDGELDKQQIMMSLENGMYYGLNVVGKRIWDLIENPKSFEDIKEILLSEFEVTEEQCIQELKFFLDTALKKELIVKSEIP